MQLLAITLLALGVANVKANVALSDDIDGVADTEPPVITMDLGELITYNDSGVPMKYCEVITSNATSCPEPEPHAYDHHDGALDEQVNRAVWRFRECNLCSGIVASKLLGQDSIHYQRCTEAQTHAFHEKQHRICALLIDSL